MRESWETSPSRANRSTPITPKSQEKREEEKREEERETYGCKPVDVPRVVLSRVVRREVGSSNLSRRQVGGGKGVSPRLNQRAKAEARTVRLRRVLPRLRRVSGGRRRPSCMGSVRGVWVRVWVWIWEGDVESGEGNLGFRAWDPNTGLQNCTCTSDRFGIWPNPQLVSSPPIHPIDTLSPWASSNNARSRTARHPDTTPSGFQTDTLPTGSHRARSRPSCPSSQR